MEKTYNWGIIGPGKIAHKFAKDLARTTNGRLWAVASRSLDRAQVFANQYSATHTYGSYADLMDCPGLDAVYIATPHPGHFENTLMCLGSAIPVLCEKPLAMNGRQVEQMITAAREQNTFLMEAIWTRFLPAVEKTLSLIEAGVLGDLVSVKADFGAQFPFLPDSRIFNRELGGGALLDIGIYPVFLAMLILGKPNEVKALAQIGSTGVDEDLGMVFKYQNGTMAHLHSTLKARTKCEAFIYGTRATIHLHPRWHETRSLTVLKEGQRPEWHQFEREAFGYQYEIEEVMRCLDQGLQESPKLPLSFSRDLMLLMDNIRAEAGIVYPHD